MQVSRFADYGLRVLIYLAQGGERMVTMKEIADFFGISHDHLRKVVHHLSRAGHIRSSRGRNGGLSLRDDPRHLRIGDILAAMDKPAAIVDCFGANPCRLAPGCRLETALLEARSAFVEHLNGYTLADMAAAPTMRRKFPPR